MTVDAAYRCTHGTVLTLVDYEPSTLPFSIETSLIFKIMFYCNYY